MTENPGMYGIDFRLDYSIATAKRRLNYWSAIQGGLRAARMQQEICSKSGAQWGRVETRLRDLVNAQIALAEDQLSELATAEPTS